MPLLPAIGPIRTARRHWLVVLVALGVLVVPAAFIAADGPHPAAGAGIIRAAGATIDTQREHVGVAAAPANARLHAIRVASTIRTGRTGVPLVVLSVFGVVLLVGFWLHRSNTRRDPTLTRFVAFRRRGPPLLRFRS